MPRPTGWQEAGSKWGPQWVILHASETHANARSSGGDDGSEPCVYKLPMDLLGQVLLRASQQQRQSHKPEMEHALGSYSLVCRPFRAAVQQLCCASMTSSLSVRHGTAGLAWWLTHSRHSVQSLNLSWEWGVEVETVLSALPPQLRQLQLDYKEASIVGRASSRCLVPSPLLHLSSLSHFALHGKLSEPVAWALALGQLVPLAQLRHLDISHSTLITAADGLALAQQLIPQLQQLTSLDLSGTRITPEQLQLWGTLPSLQSIRYFDSVASAHSSSRTIAATSLPLLSDLPW